MARGTPQPKTCITLSLIAGLSLLPSIAYAEPTEVSDDILYDVENILDDMRTSRFDRHSCGGAPRFPSSYDTRILQRLSQDSEDWYGCLAEHISDLRYEAEQMTLNLEASLLYVPRDHPIWRKVAWSIENYNKRADIALQNAQSEYSNQQDRAEVFVERVNKERRRQETLARLQYGLECATEQSIAASTIRYDMWGNPIFASWPVIDTEGCIERKMAGIETSPWDYFPAQYYTPGYYYVPQNEVRITIDSYGDLPPGTHVDVGFDIPDDDDY